MVLCVVNGSSAVLDGEVVGVKAWGMVVTSLCLVKRIGNLEVGILIGLVHSLGWLCTGIVRGRLIAGNGHNEEGRRRGGIWLGRRRDQCLCGRMGLCLRVSLRND